MVSQNQASTDDTEYDSDAERIFATKSKPILLSIKPTTEEMAREWLGAYNQSDWDDSELRNHFVTQVKLNKGK